MPPKRELVLALPACGRFRNKNEVSKDERESNGSDESQLPRGDNEYVEVSLPPLHTNFQCPICLGILRKTRAVMECLHRFCRECIEKAMRACNNECPTCRTHCSSRRSLRDDPNYDALIETLYPDIDKYEKEYQELNKQDGMIQSLKEMQENYNQTLRRQEVAAGKRCLKVKKKPRVTVRSLDLRSTVRNVAGSRNRGGRRRSRVLSADEEEEGESDEDVEEDTVDAGQSNVNNVVSDEPEMSVLDMLRSTSTLAWGGRGQRNDTIDDRKRNAVAARRNKRIANLVEHLRNSSINEHLEVEMSLMLVSYEENRVSNLQHPFISCSSTLSVKQLRQYVANQTSLVNEEIELYVVKECPTNIITDEAKLDPNTTNFHLLKMEEEPLSQLTSYLSLGHLVIAYKRKKWDLNDGVDMCCLLESQL